jgi:hypothetical protein
MYFTKRLHKLLVLALILGGSLFVLGNANKVEAISRSTTYFNVLAPEDTGLNMAIYGCKYASNSLIPIVLDATGQAVGSSTVTFPDYRCMTEPGAATAERLEELKREYASSGSGIAGILINTNIALLDQRPASGVDFVLARVENTLQPGVVYAADPSPYFPGTGFTLLTPIQSFWGWTVTIAYSFMILIILVVAFGLMFQVRLDGKTVVQLQQAIPGIVLAMILIPLTYPIAGLFIDAITLGTNVYHDFLLGPAGPGSEVYKGGQAPDQSKFNELRGLYADDWRVSVFRVREFISANQLGNVVGGLICPEKSTDNSAACGQSGVNILGFVNAIVKFVTADNASLSTLVGSLLNLIFSVVFIVISFKIAWRLLKKFFVLVFFPIMLPFVAATVALPGRGTKALVDQLKQMSAASLHYIVSYIVFLTAIVITNPKFTNTIPNVQTYQFNPPLLGASKLPDLLNSVGGNLNATGLTGFLFTLIGLVMFLSLPSILDNIDKSLGVPGELIPSFLKPAIAEFQSSYDVGFRQAPAVMRSGINQIGAGATTVLSSRFVGGRRATPFDQTDAEKFVKAEQEELGRLRTRAAAASNPFSKAIYSGAAAVRQNLYSNPLASVQGQAGKIVPRQEEKGPSVDMKLNFPILGSDYYSLNVRQITRILASATGGAIGGTLSIKVAEGSTRPIGVVFLKTYGDHAGNPNMQIIGKVTPSGGGTDAEVVLDLKGGSLGRVSGGVIQITDNTKTFSGKDEVELDIGLYGLTPTIQVWDTAGRNKVNAAIGSSALSPLRKTAGVTIRVTP